LRNRVPHPLRPFTRLAKNEDFVAPKAPQFMEALLGLDSAGDGGRLLEQEKGKLLDRREAFPFEKPFEARKPFFGYLAEAVDVASRFFLRQESVALHAGLRNGMTDEAEQFEQSEEPLSGPLPRAERAVKPVVGIAFRCGRVTQVELSR